MGRMCSRSCSVGETCARQRYVFQMECQTYGCHRATAYGPKNFGVHNWPFALYMKAVSRGRSRKHLPLCYSIQAQIRTIRGGRPTVGTHQVLADLIGMGKPRLAEIEGAVGLVKTAEDRGATLAKSFLLDGDLHLRYVGQPSMNVWTKAMLTFSLCRRMVAICSGL